MLTLSPPNGGTYQPGEWRDATVRLTAPEDLTGPGKGAVSGTSVPLSSFLHSVAGGARKLNEIPDIRVLLCHASEDKGVVYELSAHLDRANVEIWYDKREIKPGDMGWPLPARI